MGMQNQIRVDRVLRTPYIRSVSNQDVVITEDGEQYRIDMVQKTNGIYPTSMDLTLYQIQQKYEVKE